MYVWDYVEVRVFVYVCINHYVDILLAHYDVSMVEFLLIIEHYPCPRIMLLIIHPSIHTMLKKKLNLTLLLLL